MENRAITDKQITASSKRGNNYAAMQGRLNFQSIFKAGSWSAGTNNLNQWLQIDLGGQYAVVKRIATQGRNAWNFDQWVKKYKLQYSNDTVGSFQHYKGLGKNKVKVKNGNNLHSAIYSHINH